MSGKDLQSIESKGTDASRTDNRDLLLVFMLVLLSSGNPAFLPVGNVELTLLPSAALLLVLFACLPHPKMKRSDMIVFAIFFGLNLIHVAVLQMTAVYTALGFFVRLFIAFAVVRLTKNTNLLVVRAITIFAILANVMLAIDVVLNVFGVDLAVLLEPISLQSGTGEATHAIIHNFNGAEDRDRNAGIFWEPGALAGYCLLALMLWGVSIRRYSTRQSCVVVPSLIAALVSSFSTTGFVLLPLALLVPVFSRITLKPLTVLVNSLVGIPILVVATMQIAQLPFVAEKISHQIETTQSEAKNWQLNRIGQLLNDVDDILARPLTGWGANPRATPSANASDLDEDSQSAQGNGLSRFVVEFGLIGFGTFVFFAYRNFRLSENAPAFVAAYAAFVCCLTLSGEMFLNYPLFMSLMFLPNAESLGSPVWVQIRRGGQRSVAAG